MSRRERRPAPEWLRDPARGARLSAMAVGLGGCAFILLGIRRHDDILLIVGVALFLPGMIVALRSVVRPPKERPEGRLGKIAVARDEEVTPRGKGALLLGVLALIGAMLLAIGALSSAWGLAAVGGVLLVAGAGGTGAAVQPTRAPERSWASLGGLEAHHESRTCLRQVARPARALDHPSE